MNESSPGYAESHRKHEDQPSSVMKIKFLFYSSLWYELSSYFKGVSDHHNPLSLHHSSPVCTWLGS